MDRILVLCLCLVLLSVAVAFAGTAGGDEQSAEPGSATETEPADAAGPAGKEPREAGAAGGTDQTDAAPDGGGDGESEAKELSGMSIVGNDEAPKSLYIVPWKSSEIGVQTSLDMMLSEEDSPVDREVFRRRVEFYQVRTRQ